MNAKRPIVILGPTAGGKTDLAVSLAEQLNGEVIGADSMQVYRHLDAGTAKPSHALRAWVPHHLIDVVEPTDRFTVHDWRQQAEAAMADMQARGVRPIVVGGTNLYLKALLEGMFDGPGQDDAFRATLEAIDSAELHARMRAVDPEAGERIKPADRKRIIRALEVFHLSGKPISDWQQEWDQETGGAAVEPDQANAASPPRRYRHDPILIGLRWPAEAINPRINLRVKAMFYPEKVDPEIAREVCINGEDLITETRRLEAAKLLGEQAREALGTKQVLAYLSGAWTEEDAFEKTKVLTRRFAKQQRTWLKRYLGVHWIDAVEMDVEAQLESAMEAIKTAV